MIVNSSPDSKTPSPQSLPQRFGEMLARKFKVLTDPLLQFRELYESGRIAEAIELGSNRPKLQHLFLAIHTGETNTTSKQPAMGEYLKHNQGTPYFRCYIEDIEQTFPLSAEQKDRLWQIWDRYQNTPSCRTPLGKERSAYLTGFHVTRFPSYHKENFINLFLPRLVHQYSKYSEPLLSCYLPYLFSLLPDNEDVNQINKIITRSASIHYDCTARGYDALENHASLEKKLGIKNQLPSYYCEARTDYATQFYNWVKGLQEGEVAFIIGRWHLDQGTHYVGYLFTNTTISLIDPADDLGEILELPGRKTEAKDGKTWIHPFLTFRFDRNTLEPEFFENLFDMTTGQISFETKREYLTYALKELKISQLSTQYVPQTHLKYKQQTIANCQMKLVNTFVKGFVDGLFKPNGERLGRQVMKEVKAKGLELFREGLSKELKDDTEAIHFGINAFYKYGHISETVQLFNRYPDPYQLSERLKEELPPVNPHLSDPAFPVSEQERGKIQAAWNTYSALPIAKTQWGIQRVTTYAHLHGVRDPKLHKRHYLYLNHPSKISEHPEIDNPSMLYYAPYLLHLTEGIEGTEEFREILKQAIEIDVDTTTRGLLALRDLSKIEEILGLDEQLPKTYYQARAAYANKMIAWVNKLKPGEKALTMGTWTPEEGRHSILYLIEAQESGMFSFSIVDSHSELSWEAIDQSKIEIHPFLTFQNLSREAVTSENLYITLFEMQMGLETYDKKEKYVDEILNNLGLRYNGSRSFYRKKDDSFVVEPSTENDCSVKVLNTVLMRLNSDRDRILQKVRQKSQKTYEESCQNELKNDPEAEKILSYSAHN